jgi:hypothetical protein
MEQILLASLGKQYMPNKPRKKRALRLALEAIEAEGLITKIRDDSDMLAYGLSEIIKDKAKVDFTQKKQNIIILDKATGKIEFRMTHKNSEIEDLFRKYQEIYTEADLREIALRFMLDMNGITMREHGGVYFLPMKSDSDKLRTFFTSAGCEYHDVALNPEASNRTEVKVCAAADFIVDLEKAAADVEFHTGKDNTRESTLASRLQKFQLLRKRAEAYSELVSMDISDLTKKLDKLREQVEKSLLGEKKDWPQAKKYAYKSHVKFTCPGDPLDNAIGMVIGYDEDIRGGKKHPICKVLFDNGELVPIYAYEENIVAVGGAE